MNKTGITVSVYDPKTGEFIHEMISNRDSMICLVLSIIGGTTVYHWAIKGTGYVFKKIKAHLSDKEEG